MTEEEIHCPHKDCKKWDDCLVKSCSGYEPPANGEKEFIGYFRKDGTIEFKSDIQVTREIADSIMGLSLEDFGLEEEEE